MTIADTETLDDRPPGVMQVPAGEDGDSNRRYLNGTLPDGGLWTALRRSSDHDHTGALNGAPISVASLPDGSITIDKLDPAVLLPYALVDGSKPFTGQVTMEADAIVRDTVYFGQQGSALPGGRHAGPHGAGGAAALRGREPPPRGAGDGGDGERPSAQVVPGARLDLTANPGSTERTGTWRTPPPGRPPRVEKPPRSSSATVAVGLTRPPRGSRPPPPRPHRHPHPDPGRGSGRPHRQRRR